MNPGNLSEAPGPVGSNSALVSRRFSTAAPLVAQTGPFIPCDLICSPESLQPERLGVCCAASCLAGRRALRLRSDRGSGISRRVLSSACVPAVRWPLLRCLHNWAGELNLFLLSGAATSCAS